MVQNRTVRLSRLLGNKLKLILTFLMISEMLCFLCAFQTAEPALIPQTPEPTLISQAASETAKTAVPTEEVKIPEGKTLVHEQKFSSDHTLKGYYSQFSEYFLTGNWRVESATLTLDISSSQLINVDNSTMNLSINGTLFYSRKIPFTSGERQKLSVNVPLSLLNLNNYNNIKVEVFPSDVLSNTGIYQNTQQSVTPTATPTAQPQTTVTPTAVSCLNDYSNTVWINFFADSSIRIQYQQLRIKPNLDEFLNQFVSIDAMENDQSTIAIPFSADEAILTTEANIASGLSIEPKLSFEKMHLTRADSLSDLSSFRTIIYISRYETLDSKITELLTEDEKKTAAKTAVATVKKSGSQYILIITGKDPDAIKNAGYMLTNTDLRTQLNKSSKEITAGDNYQMDPDEFNPYYTLTQDGTDLRGFFHQETSFYIDVPSNRKVMKASELKMDFSYSDNIDFKYSLVTIYVNDIPIGSKKLTKELASADSLDLQFPENIQIHGPFSIKVAFDLGINENECIRFTEEMPWAHVAPTSMLKLDSIEGNDLIFENYPSPFIRDGRLNELAVVLPEKPREADIQAMHRMMLVIGRYRNNNSGEINVVFDSEPDKYKNKNVIAIGLYDLNQVIQDNKASLLFSVEKGKNAFQSNTHLVLDPDYALRSGFSQLMKSPYSDSVYGLLIVTGTTDEGLQIASEYLGTSVGLWKLSGNAFLAADTDQVHTFQPTQADNRTAIQKILDSIRTNSGTAIGISLLVGLLGVLILFAAFMLILKYKRK